MRVAPMVVMLAREAEFSKNAFAAAAAAAVTAAIRSSIPSSSFPIIAT